MNSELSQGTGYGVVLCVGFSMFLITVTLIRLMRRYKNMKEIDMQHYSNAGRSTGRGLMTTIVVSSMTWTATLVMSCAQTYFFGISGSFFLGLGGTYVLLSFVVLAMEMKVKAPTANTFTEFVRVRYGRSAHLVFVFFGLLSTMFTTIELLVGTAETFHYISGMNRVAATFLPMVPVTLYTILGGLKGSQIADYINIVVLSVTLLILTMTIFISNRDIGSPGKLWELCKAYTETQPIKGNAHGSLLTMRSRPSGLWLVNFIPSISSPVFLDQGHWNMAMSAKPDALMPAFLFGGVLWFGIPFCAGTAIGLAGRALQNSPRWPSYPNPMEPRDIYNGLVISHVAVAVFGKRGAGAAIVLVYTSALSCAAVEMVGTATLLTYDVYTTYINPKATARRQMMIAYSSLVLFIVSMCGVSIGLGYAKFTVGYLLNLNAIACGSAIIPYIVMLYWRGMNKYAAIWSPILGVICGVACYIGTTAGLYHDRVTVITTLNLFPIMSGTLIATGTPVVFIPIFQLIFGNDKFDWAQLRSCGVHDQPIMEKKPQALPDAERDPSPPDSIPAANRESDVPSSRASTTSSTARNPTDGEQTDDGDNTGGDTYNTNASLTTDNSASAEKEEFVDTPDGRMPLEIAEYLQQEKKLRTQVVQTRWISAILILCIVVIWPFTMYGTRYIFSKHFFVGWCTVSLIWFFGMTAFVVIMPLWDSRYSILLTLRGIYWDVTGQARKMREWQAANPDRMFHDVTSRKLGKVGL